MGRGAPQLPTQSMAESQSQSQSQSLAQSVSRRPSEVLRANEEDDEKWEGEKEKEQKKAIEDVKMEKGDEDKRTDVRAMVVSELMRWMDEKVKHGQHGRREGSDEANQGSDFEPLARGISALLRLAHSTLYIAYVLLSAFSHIPCQPSYEDTI